MSGPVGCKATPKRQKQGWVNFVLSYGVRKTVLPARSGLIGKRSRAEIRRSDHEIAGRHGQVDPPLPLCFTHKIGALAVQTTRTSLNLSTALVDKMDAAWALPESPYDLLGVADDCSTADVKKAYRDMARSSTPEKHGRRTSRRARPTSSKSKRPTRRCRTQGAANFTTDGCSPASDWCARTSINTP